MQSLRTAYVLALRTTQALRSSVFAGCSPSVVVMQRIYIVRHICTPCVSYLQALCIICAGLMQHICRPCAAYLQAAPYLQALLCIRVVGPVAHGLCIRPCASYLQALFLCSICTPCAAYLQPTVHHICIYLAGSVASASYLQVASRHRG